MDAPLCRSTPTDAAVLASTSTPDASLPADTPRCLKSGSYVSMERNYALLLSRQATELEAVANANSAYRGAVRALFPPPPVVLPSHLCNTFGPNTLPARPHAGRLDTNNNNNNTTNTNANTNHSSNANEDGALVVGQRGTSRMSGGWAAHQTDRLSSRFSIRSLPNGDVREHDACDGRRYWDSTEPPIRVRPLPSRLLNERDEEAMHNYRFHSRRWRGMLEELANALDADAGKALMQRYATREDGLPLPPKCRRAFYESVVDYEELMDQQVGMLQDIERGYGQYLSGILDSREL